MKKKRYAETKMPDGWGPRYPKSYLAAKKIQAASRELKENPPSILAKTRKKKGKTAERRQRIAIMLNKARRGKS